MSGKAILIVVLGIMSISYVSYETIMTHTNESSKTIGDYFYEQQAYNISQTGINMALKKLENQPNWRQGFYFKDLFNGLVYVQLKDTLFGIDSVVKISSQGIMGYNTDDELRANSIAFSIRQTTVVTVPKTIKAAVTSNTKVSTSGKMVIDGRDHDLEGKLIAGEGTYALWTTENYSRSGNSTIGGSKEGKDYAPSKNVNDNVRRHKQDWEVESDDSEDDDSDSKDDKKDDDDKDEDDDNDYDDDKKDPAKYPTTPEDALGGSEYGFTQDKLKELAKSGQDGSQYVTDPNKLSNNPLSGITYVELGDKKSWQSVNIAGSGILIVHNSYGNALIKNLNSGTFKGIIIADDIINIHTEILGAVFTLSTKSSGSVIGNGNGSILYSSEAIRDALLNFSTKTEAGESGKKGVVAWWD